MYVHIKTVHLQTFTFVVEFFLDIDEKTSLNNNKKRIESHIYYKTQCFNFNILQELFS